MSHYSDLEDKFCAYQSQWFEEPRQADYKSSHDTFEQAAVAALDDTRGRIPFIGQKATGTWWKHDGERWLLIKSDAGQMVAINKAIKAFAKPNGYPDVRAIGASCYNQGIAAANQRTL